MAYDEILEGRIRSIIADQPGLVAKKMFGGVGFLLDGNMACGVHKEDLIVRVGLDRFAEALEQPHVRVFDITGKPMKGWVMVGPPGYQADEDLNAWVALGVDFARALPPK